MLGGARSNHCALAFMGPGLRFAHPGMGEGGASVESPESLDSSRMNPTARKRALDALKGRRATAPAGPLFAVAEEGASYDSATLDKVAVLFPLPLPEPFDYRAPSSLGLKPGMHVIAPIGTRLVRGVVWAVEQNHPGAANLKAIEEVLPGPLVPE